MNWRRVSAWVLMLLVALSSGAVQAFVHVCSSQGPQWSESSCSVGHHAQPSCCSKKASVQPKSCCESVYLFGLSAKFKDRIPQQEWPSPTGVLLCKALVSSEINWEMEAKNLARKVPFSPPDVRVIIQRINQ